VLFVTVRFNFVFGFFFFILELNMGLICSFLGFFPVLNSDRCALNLGGLSKIWVLIWGIELVFVLLGGF
jgi:hypothetical protein